MEISTEHFTVDEGRSLLTSVLVPRPVGWISTASMESGRRNLAPFSSIAPLCDKPPLVAFSCSRRPDGSRKETARNIVATGEFVVNFVGPGLLETICRTADEPPGDIDDYERVGVDELPSRTVAVPRIAGSIASLECRFFQLLELGASESRVDFIIGIVLHAFVDKPANDWTQFKGIGALGIDWYLVDGLTKCVPRTPR
jgi:flavin reductase (DIM6/NTAB) family NADH-FMN oxidoreductase RutF